MLVAIVGGIRIEQVFTSDAERLIDALDRMEYDITLWNANYAHLTELPFFASLESLFDVLSTVSGAKAVVLFSDNPASASENDLQFASLAASASASRCSVYAVHSTGLVNRRTG